MTPATAHAPKIALGRAAMHALDRRSLPASPADRVVVSPSTSAHSNAGTQVDGALFRWSKIILDAVRAKPLGGGASTEYDAATAALLASSPEGMTTRLVRAIREHSIVCGTARDRLKDLTTSDIRLSFARVLLTQVFRGWYKKDELGGALAIECALVVAAGCPSAADVLWDMGARSAGTGMSVPGDRGMLRTRQEFANVALKLLPLVLGPASGDARRTELHVAAGLMFDALLDPTDVDLRRKVRALPPECVGAVGQRLNLSVAAVDLLWKASSTEGMALRSVQAPYHGYAPRLNLGRTVKEARADAALAVALAEPLPPSLVDGNSDGAGVLGAHAGRLNNGVTPLRIALERIWADRHCQHRLVVSLDVLDELFPRRSDLYALALSALFEQPRGSKVLGRALDAFSGWREEKLDRADAESWGTTQREASVASALLGLASSVTGVFTDPCTSDQAPPEERVQEAMPAFANLVGHKDVAKNAQVRTALIYALYNVFATSVVERCRGPMLESLAEIVERASDAAPGAALALAKEITEALVRLEFDIQARASNLASVLNRVQERLGKEDRHVQSLVGYLHKQRYLGDEQRAEAVATALAEGSLSVLRWQTLSGGSLGIHSGPETDPVFDASLRRWHIEARDTIGRYEVFDSGEPQHWVEAVNTVTSCLRTDGSPKVNHALLHRFLDGWVRVFAARDASKETNPICARAAGRLAVRTEENRPRLTLYLDTIYPLPQDRDDSRGRPLANLPSPEDAQFSPTDALLLYAKSRARDLGADFASADSYGGEG